MIDSTGLIFSLISLLVISLAIYMLRKMRKSIVFEGATFLEEDLKDLKSFCSNLRKCSSIGRNNWIDWLLRHGYNLLTNKEFSTMSAGRLDINITLLIALLQALSRDSPAIELSQYSRTLLKAVYPFIERNPLILMDIARFAKRDIKSIERIAEGMDKEPPAPKNTPKKASKSKPIPPKTEEGTEKMQHQQDSDMGGPKH